MEDDRRGNAVSVHAVRVETAARMLDASAQQVLYEIRQGRLPAFKFGRAWRIKVEDIQRLNEGRAS